MVDLPFANRTEAGRLLADQLYVHQVPGDAIVLALPRGGVPVGSAIAERLHLAFDVVVARKLGVPWQPELAMGAIAGRVRLLDEQLVRELGVDDDGVEVIVNREQAEIDRQEEIYRDGRAPPDLRGRYIVLVDDGIAMGSTMMAAARYVRSMNPAKVVIAVPVGSRQACMRLMPEVDDLVCLAVPEPFQAVGRWYRNFHQVSDSEVQALLAESLQLSTKATDRHLSSVPDPARVSKPGADSHSRPRVSG
jgi:predicted phosphoribosyltransferase